MSDESLRKLSAGLSAQAIAALSAHGDRHEVRDEIRRRAGAVRWWGLALPPFVDLDPVTRAPRVAWRVPTVGRAEGLLANPFGIVVLARTGENWTAVILDAESGAMRGTPLAFRAHRLIVAVAEDVVVFHAARAGGGLGGKAPIVAFDLLRATPLWETTGALPLFEAAAAAPREAPAPNARTGVPWVRRPELELLHLANGATGARFDNGPTVWFHERTIVDDVHAHEFAIVRVASREDDAAACIESLVTLGKGGRSGWLDLPRGETVRALAVARDTTVVGISSPGAERHRLVALDRSLDVLWEQVVAPMVPDRLCALPGKVVCLVESAAGAELLCLT